MIGFHFTPICMVALVPVVWAMTLVYTWFKGEGAPLDTEWPPDPVGSPRVTPQGRILSCQGREEHRRDPLSQALMVVLIALFAIPPLFVALCYGMTIAAWLKLGRLPRPMLDDPGNLHLSPWQELVGVFMVSTLVTMYLAPAALTVLPKRSRPHVLWPILFAAALVFLTFFEPFPGFWHWYFD